MFTLPLGHWKLFGLHIYVVPTAMHRIPKVRRFRGGLAFYFLRNILTISPR